MNNIDQTYRRLWVLVAISEGILWFLTLIIYFLLFKGNNSIYFSSPQNFFFWLAFIPLLVGFWFTWNYKKTIYNKYSGFGNTRVLWLTFNVKKAFISYLALRMVLYFIVLALAQPVGGSHKVKGSKRILDIVICLDISNSMNAKDMGGGSVSRLQAAKNAISQLLSQTTGERIAVVIFANDAFVQLPLTLDYGAARTFVPEIESNMITSQGTNIGAALEVAQTQFQDSESGKAVLIISDGEDHEELWHEQAKKLKEQKTELAFLGLGTESGALVPIDPYDPNSAYLRDGASPVLSRLNVNALKAMSNESSAKLLISSSAFPDMQELTNTYKNAKNKTVKSLEFNIEENYFQYPTIAAILCLLLFLFSPFILGEKWKES